ncbi:aromatic ring-hydroxylating dioxygenase subunit alpha [Niallia oryzisoli]|uniref:aromatic ring-hydroxylating oxygenase subunit alpha n=1 Tax=Niallia oryzisoli TaxID=1737571 RepID=UPI0037362A90
MGNQTTTFIIDNKAENQFLVNRKAFVDQAIFEQERAKIFEKCWIYVGHESEIKNNGDFHTRTIAGKPIIFTRDAEGEVRVLLNTCTHRGSLVCRGEKGNCKTFLCTYHAWSFKNSGELVGVPLEKDGYAQNFNKRSLDLHRVRNESYKGFVFCNFDDNAISLEEYLGGAKEYLDYVADQSVVGMEVLPGTHKYAIRANWKLLGENSIDGYHVGYNHKTYLDFIAEEGQDVSKGLYGEGKALEGGHAVMQYEAPWGRPIAKAQNNWDDEKKARIAKKREELVERFGEEKARMMADISRNVWIFPNLIINDIVSVTIRTWDPVSPDYMEVNAWALGPIDEDKAEKELRLDNFLTFLGPGGFATPDDIESLETAQLGFKNTVNQVQWSDISRGMHREVSPTTDEKQMRAFWRKYDQLMNAEEKAVQETNA